MNCLRFFFIFCLFGFSIFPAKSVFAKEPNSSPTTTIQSLVSDPVLVFVGDSLTEGYGIPADKAYPALIQNKIIASKNSKIKSWKVVNGGVSGSTSASAESRVRWHLRMTPKPRMIFLALGANDGLRGLAVAETEKNLLKAIRLAQGAGVKVILGGMMMPPNYGEKYNREFRELFPRVAKESRVPFVPFVLEGVAGKKEFNLADGIHPNVQGHERMADLIWKYLEGHL